jgi:hypothetical protein
VWIKFIDMHVTFVFSPIALTNVEKEKVKGFSSPKTPLGTYAKYVDKNLKQASINKYTLTSQTHRESPNSYLCCAVDEGVCAGTGDPSNSE